MRANGWMIVMTAVLIAPDVSAQPDFSQVPGVVVAHSPASSGIYIGSPSLAVLDSGEYIASHDKFGPKSGYTRSGITSIYCSRDRGATWSHLADINGQFWSTLFTHRGKLYIMGVDKHDGNAVIRRSDDGGKTWTTPRDGKSGLLLEGEYHCAPGTVVEHRGRLWRAMENAAGSSEQFGKRGVPHGSWQKPMMMSAPVDADLLDARSWTCTNAMVHDAAWCEGKMEAWVEGNAVVAPPPGGGIVNFLRVKTHSHLPIAAIIRISDDGKTATFDPQTGFVRPFYGGDVRFCIRWDQTTRRYWSLVGSPMPTPKRQLPNSTRNNLSLASSPDLLQWTVHRTLLSHPDAKAHAFQYADWRFDGDDMIALSRTAYDDGLGGAKNAHDANFLTFHRFENFRTMAE